MYMAILGTQDQHDDYVRPPTLFPLVVTPVNNCPQVTMAFLDHLPPGTSAPGLLDILGRYRIIVRTLVMMHRVSPRDSNSLSFMSLRP